MKHLKLRPHLVRLIGVALLAGMVFFSSEAQALDGGDFMGGGFLGGGFVGTGFPSGGFVGDGFVGSGFAGDGFVGSGFPRGGFAGSGFPTGGFPGGGGYYGGAHMVTVPGNLGEYSGPGGGAPAPGVVTPLKTGMLVSALPTGAVAQTVKGQRYFFDGYTYYTPCSQGAEQAYCVVLDPNK